MGPNSVLPLLEIQGRKLRQL